VVIFHVAVEEGFVGGDQDVLGLLLVAVVGMEAFI
jgi:hypothetical protein